MVICNNTYGIKTDKFPDDKGAQKGIQNYYNEPEYEYLGFSQFIQSAFIGEGKHITDTGNFRNVNSVLIPKIADKIQKHPWIWKMFFKIK